MTPAKWAILMLYSPFGTLLSFSRIILTAVVCLAATLSEQYLPWTLSDKA